MNEKEFIVQDFKWFFDAFKRSLAKHEWLTREDGEFYLFKNNREVHISKVFEGVNFGLQSMAVTRVLGPTEKHTKFSNKLRDIMLEIIRNKE